MVNEVNSGDEVKDIVTGFKGIVVGLHSYLYGCTRVSVQPKASKTNDLSDAKSFDEPSLVVIKSKKAKRGPTNVGGPAKCVGLRKY